MTDEIKAAVEELKAAFPGHGVSTEDGPNGGAFVKVSDLDFGPTLIPKENWIGFTIPAGYPFADVYPHFTPLGLRRVDGRELGEGLTGQVPWNDITCNQISRRTNGWNPSVDTAATKLVKVLQWLRTR